MPHLHECLTSLTVENLKAKLSLLSLTFKNPRKAELLEALSSALQGSNLKQTWQLLNPAEQQALAEVCHSQDLCFDQSHLAAKYGSAPPLTRPKKPSDPRFSYGYESGPPTPITLFLYNLAYPYHLGIPSDLADALRSFVPEPPPTKITTLTSPPDEDDLRIRHTESEALQDIPALLHLAESGDLRITAKTIFPTATGEKHILKTLTNGDYFPPEISHPPNPERWEQKLGFIKAIGLARLLKIGGYLSSTFTGNPTADNDGDQLTAFAEYAFGTDDSDATDSIGLTTFLINETGHWVLTFPQRLSADDVIATVQTSTDLKNWSPLTPAQGTLTKTTLDGPQLLRTYTSTLPTNQNRIFLRVRFQSAL